MSDPSPEPRARMEKALERAKVVGRRPLFSDVALQMPTWEDGFEAGYAARDVEAEERESRLRDALGDAESFIETVEQWSGSDPDEIHEALAEIRAALAVSSTENEEG